jgi:RHS repeat-associated protein
MAITVTTEAKHETTSAPSAVLLQTRVRGLAAENTTAIGLAGVLSSTLRWSSWQVYDGTASARLVGLDYFGARYFSGAQGRFTSPDLPFAGQNAFDPQSWNLFSYGFNNPLRFADPTGRCSKDGNGGYTDDGKGEFPGPCVQGNTATATAPKVRDLQAEGQARAAEAQAAIDSLIYGHWRSAQAANQPMPDASLSPSAQQTMTAIANAAPTTCGGGGFFYAGLAKGTESGKVEGFAGYLG